MRLKNISIYTILLGLILSSCYKHEDITAELGKPRYKIQKGDELDNAIYDYYQSYTRFILCDYDTLDYQWNITETNTSYDFQIQDDRKILFDGLNYLNKVFLNLYDNEFKKKYLPYKIYLSKKLVVGKRGNLSDATVHVGQAYLAIGKIREGIESLTPEELNNAKGEINGKFWGEYLKINNKYKIPEEFYSVTKNMYYVDARNYFGNQGKKTSEIDIMDYGFWKGNPYWKYGIPRTPKREQDISDFMNAIMSMTSAEIQANLEGHPLLKAKYDILINHFKQTLGFDLQKIGNLRFENNQENN